MRVRQTPRNHTAHNRCSRARDQQGTRLKTAKEQDDATVETAKVISRKVFGHELQESERDRRVLLYITRLEPATGGLLERLQKSPK